MFGRNGCCGASIQCKRHLRSKSVNVWLNKRSVDARKKASLMEPENNYTCMCHPTPIFTSPVAKKSEEESSRTPNPQYSFINHAQTAARVWATQSPSFSQILRVWLQRNRNPTARRQCYWLMPVLGRPDKVKLPHPTVECRGGAHCPPFNSCASWMNPRSWTWGQCIAGLFTYFPA